MKYIVTGLALIVFLSMVVMGVSEAEEGVDEGKRIAYLTIEGKEQTLILGEESDLTVGGKKYKVKLRLDPYSIFSNAGVSFKYHSFASCHSDESTPQLNMWTIDGDSSTIMVQEYSVSLDIGDFMETLKDNYSKMNAKCTIADIERKAVDRSLKGKYILVNAPGFTLYQEVHSFRLGKKTVMIILQDTMGEEKTHSKEFNEAVAVFQKTLKTGK